MQGGLTATTALDATESTTRTPSHLADFVTLIHTATRSIGAQGLREVVFSRATWDSLLLTRLRQSVASTNREKETLPATIVPNAHSQFDDIFLDALDSVFAEMVQNWDSCLV